MKKIIAALAAVIVAALLFTSCTININGFSMYDVYANADKYTAGSFEYGRSEIKKVVIDWVSGRVEVNEEEGETLKVYEDSDSLEEDKRIHYYIDNGVLRIRFCASGYNGTFTPDEVDKNKTVYVNIPEGIDVEINTVSATVWLYTAHPYTSPAAGKTVTAKPLSVKIATTSGDVDTGKFECGKATFTSVSGEIKTGALICDEGKIETVSGTLNIFGAVKSLTAKSISGDITFIGYATENAKFESVSGGIFAKGNIASISAKSVSGAVEVGGIFENATVSTTSGNVTITDFSGTLEFNTTSGKLKSDIPHTENGKKYIFGNGSQTAKISTVSGNLTIGD